MSLICFNLVYTLKKTSCLNCKDVLYYQFDILANNVHSHNCFLGISFLSCVLCTIICLFFFFLFFSHSVVSLFSIYEFDLPSGIFLTPRVKT